MKGLITLIRRIIDENEIVRGYEIIVETQDLPNLKLGECEIKNV